MSVWLDGGTSDERWRAIARGEGRLDDGALTELEEHIARQRALVARLYPSHQMPPPSTADSQHAGCTSTLHYERSSSASRSVLEPTAADRAAGSAVAPEVRRLAVAADASRRLDDFGAEATELRVRMETMTAEHAAAQRQAVEAVDAAEQRALQAQLSMQQELERMQARLDERDQRVLELEREGHSAAATATELRARVATLEEYLADLPTQEEFSERGERLAEETHRAELIAARLEDAEREVLSLTEAVADRDTRYATSRAELNELNEVLRESQAARLAEVREVEHSREQLAVEMDRMARQLDATQRELRESEATRVSLKQRVDDVCMALADEEGRTRRADVALAELREDVKRLQQKERQQQTTINALEDVKFTMERKLAAQASTIHDLRQALTALRTANQELLAGHVVTRTVSVPEERPGEGGLGLPTPTDVARAAEVQDALAECLHELQSLVHTVQAKSRGEEPPIGEMLGLDRPDALGAHFVRTNDPHEQLHTISEMRAAVARLRQQVCDVHAADLTSDACAMQ